MRKCSSKICNEKANREVSSGYCELSHPLEEEIEELKQRWEDLGDYLEREKFLYSLTGQTKPFYEALKKMEELSKGKT